MDILSSNLQLNHLVKERSRSKDLCKRLDWSTTLFLGIFDPAPSTFSFKETQVWGSLVPRPPPFLAWGILTLRDRYKIKHFQTVLPSLLKEKITLNMMLWLELHSDYTGRFEWLYSHCKFSDIMVVEVQWCYRFSLSPQAWVSQEMCGSLAEAQEDLPHLQTQHHKRQQETDGCR